MRINANITPLGWKYKAYLDGTFVDYCIEADDVEGYVLVAVRDPQSGQMTDDVRRIEGNVTIEVPPELRQL